MEIAAAAGTISLGDKITVNRMGFGAMRLTGKGIWGPPSDREQCRQVLRRALELGVNFIDTADSYGPNVNEEIIAETLYPYPSDLLIATKGGFERPGPDHWKMNGRPKHLRKACEGSLKRLRLERIDLYQLHRIDPAVPEEDQFGTLEDLIREGKIWLVGLSEASVEQVERARESLPVVSLQNQYNVAFRKWENELEYCEREGLAFIPWYPLGAGKLTLQNALSRVAERNGATPMQVALAWLLARSPVMLPIPGTSKLNHLDENIRAAEIELSPKDLEEIAEL